MAEKTSFTCPTCNALYQMVRQEAGPETVNSEITCRACGGPLPNGGGKFNLKYFRKGPIPVFMMPPTEAATASSQP